MEYSGEQLRCLLALLRIPGVGSVKLSNILENESDLTALFDASDNCRVASGKADWLAVEQDLRFAESPECHILTQASQHYPDLLKEISGAPALLFARGNLKLLSRPQIAMVGSRNPTPIGCDIAHKFAEHFSNTGFTVTSGLAIGIDAAAHRGALLGVGNTVAVLGNGLDCIYPASHRDLARDIVEQQGLLISEFPIGTPPAPSHFPRRNRIISGLSVGTLVVEATLSSGSLITAKLALEQGREVFAIPGSIHSPLAKGCHALIRQGAKLVETAEDVLEELGALMKYVMRKDEGQTGEAKKLNELDEPYENLLAEIGYDCTPIDSVILRSGLTAQLVSSMLLELELMGYVAAVPGGYARLLA